MLLLAVSRRPWQPVAIAMDLSSLVEGNDDGDTGVEVWRVGVGVCLHGS